ncbi:hypothetical protein [Cellulomonas sp. S1-8]|uniref:hypothetical protein n=1 Tax=Cellulomonas sp. S1-8 TaxID=2904790 RepID=UPI002244A6A7|nr:hypothetical protein [Cellulomonas sp. S1-8]UZN02152.1 hypothetical protein OKX07_13785 [Cellulomonas sp. S1-8]
MRRVGSAAAACLLTVLLVGCTSDEAPGPTPTGTSEATAEDEAQLTVEEYAAAVLAGDDLPDADVLGETSGTVEDTPIDVQVLAVVADPAGTDLVLRLDGEHRGSFSGWSDSRGVHNDLRGVSVVDEGSGWRLRPYTIQDSDGLQDLGCACAPFPSRLSGGGADVHALLPPLTAGTQTVTVELPGLDPVTDVPVTWR